MYYTVRGSVDRRLEFGRRREFVNNGVGRVSKSRCLPWLIIKGMFTFFLKDLQSRFSNYAEGKMFFR